MYFAANPRMIGSAVCNAAGFVDDGGVSLPMQEIKDTSSILRAASGGVA
jgi:hypothetical protein